MSLLAGRKLVLGVSGGIAAYKSAILTRLLVRAGVDVHVVLSAGGARFVGAATFQALSGNPVWSDLWDSGATGGMAHIQLSRDADAILIAPASADLLARLATGQSNDLLSCLCLARTCPLLLAPAMNLQMWQNPATRRNVAQLADDGVYILEPDEGEQACGEIGAGRMLEPEHLQRRLEAFFQPKILHGRNVVLTAGPTFEAIDPVRGITNISSGQMGYALARACAEAGANVVLVSGPTALACPDDVRRIDVVSAREMSAAVDDNIETADVFIGVAAVADYRPQSVQAQKHKKTGAAMSIEFIENPDIIARVAARKNPPFCIGFAAESEKLEEYAEQKRRRKQLPLLIGNLVSEGMGGRDNTVTIFDENGAYALERADKLQVARQIVAFFAPRLLSVGNKV